ncbi:MAG TPA: hypothetical protein PKC97_03665 [Burkholderiaceae bacterium]|nr:hypothetical protein [Burkholderiaceae bacterium]
MADSGNFAKFVPGFDFLESLVKNAGAAMPGVGQWIAPTINPEEIDKRIDELRTVQYWLEQNARMLGATIQALEVQRMTLSTLKTMNVQMDALRDSMLLKMPAEAPPAAPVEAKADPVRAPAASPEAKPQPAPQGASKAAPEPAAAPGVVDPLQWWGALTKQFTELASAALEKGAAPAGGAAADAKPLADATPRKPAPRKAAARKSASRKSAARKPAPRKAG